MNDSISPFECNMTWTVDFSDEKENSMAKKHLRILKDDKQYELVGLMLEEEQF